MEISVQNDGGERYIVSYPEPEWRTRVDLVEALRGALQDKPIRGLIIDLNGVNYMNSAGLGAIFALRKFAYTAGASVVVSRPTASLNRLLNTVNLSQLIPITDSLDEARQKLIAPPPGEVQTSA